MCSGSPNPETCGTDLPIRSSPHGEIDQMQYPTALKINGSGDPLHIFVGGSGDPLHILRADPGGPPYIKKPSDGGLFSQLVLVQAVTKDDFGISRLFVGYKFRHESK